MANPGSSQSRVPLSPWLWCWSDSHGSLIAFFLVPVTVIVRFSVQIFPPFFCPPSQSAPFTLPQRPFYPPVLLLLSPLAHFFFFRFAFFSPCVLTLDPTFVGESTPHARQPELHRSDLSG